jgi:hypothetical protein
MHRMVRGTNRRAQRTTRGKARTALNITAVFFACLFPTRPAAVSSGATSLHGGQVGFYLRGEGLAAVGRGGSAGTVLPAFLGRTRDACQHFPSEPRLPTLALSVFFFTCRCNSKVVSEASIASSPPSRAK